MSGTTAPVQDSAPALPLDKEKQKKSSTWQILEEPFARTQSPFLLRYIGTNWPIFQLVSLYMSYSVSPRKLDRLLGMCLLIQSLFWYKCHQFLLITRGLHVPNVIWHRSRCHASLLLMRTCPSRIINTIDPYIRQGISAMPVLKEFRSTRSLL